MTLTIERQQFEEWFTNKYPRSYWGVEKTASGEYQGGLAAPLWEAWKESRGCMANREAQPVGKAEITKIAAELVRGDYLSKLWTEAEKSRHVDTHRLQDLLDELHDVMKVKAIAITRLLTAPPVPAYPAPKNKSQGWKIDPEYLHAIADAVGCSDDEGAPSMELVEAVLLAAAPPAPANARAVAWEMCYWNSGYNMWHDWERITAEQHAEMSVQHATDNDYEFRVLYDAPPAPAVPPIDYEKEMRFFAGRGSSLRVGRGHYTAPPAPAVNAAPDFEAWFNSPEAGLRVVNFHIQHELQLKAWNACRATMLAQPVSGGYKLPPHLYRELVNSLRDTAVKFSDTEQLRERLNTALSQFIEPDHPHTRTVAPEGGNGA